MDRKLICICDCITKLFATVMAVCGITACTDSYEPIAIHRLDRQISNGVMPDDSLSVKAAELLFEVSGYPPASALTVTDYSEKPSIHEHLATVEREYEDVSREAEELGAVFGRMHESLPEIRVPEVFTIISPFSQSIIFADSTLFIGLNHYLGYDYKYYEYFPDYIRVLKERPRIPVDVAEAIIRSVYPFKTADGYPSVAARLAYEGAVTEAVMRVTGRDEAFVLGYDEGRYRWLCDNEEKLWQTIVGRKMLFSTDFEVVRSLVDAAPYVSVISSEVPGRAGRFIGHRLVEAYMKNNPETDMPTLLQASFYNSPTLLTSAKYNP